LPNQNKLLILYLFQKYNSKKNKKNNEEV
jgi:hypothetical protein